MYENRYIWEEVHERDTVHGKAYSNTWKVQFKFISQIMSTHKRTFENTKGERNHQRDNRQTISKLAILQWHIRGGKYGVVTP